MAHNISPQTGGIKQHLGNHGIPIQSGSPSVSNRGFQNLLIWNTSPLGWEAQKGVRLHRVLHLLGSLREEKGSRCIFLCSILPIRDGYSTHLQYGTVFLSLKKLVVHGAKGV